jgi:hypothetical protein
MLIVTGDHSAQTQTHAFPISEAGQFHCCSERPSHA